MLLLGEVLAPLAPSDEFFGVARSCGPVESSSEGLADQRARGRVVSADALVDLLQDVLAFLSGDDMTMPAPTASPTTFPISTGPITRSRAKKIQQDVHALLYEFQLKTNDNFMLPKSCMLILLRYVEMNHQDEGHEARIGKVLVIQQGHSAISSNQRVIRQSIRQSPESEVRALNCTNLQSFT
jgi:hypothetical protein